MKTDDGKEVQIEDIVIFFSGAERVPPLGFPNKPSLTFLHDNSIFPTSSTCLLELRLPVKHCKYENFKEAMITALKGHGGFRMV